MPQAALGDDPSEVGYSSHEGPSELGLAATRSSSSSTGRTRRVSGRRLAREQVHARRSGSAARRRRASAATTRAVRTRELQAARGDDPERRGGGREGVSVDRVRGALGRAPEGVLQRSDRPEPEDAVDAADRRGPTAGATGATPCRPAASSARARPTSSARLSRGARRALVAAPEQPASRLVIFLGADPRRSLIFATVRRDLDAGRAAPHRAAGARGARSSRPPRGCTSSVRASSSGSGVLLIPIAVVIDLRAVAPAQARSTRSGAVIGEAAGRMGLPRGVIGTTFALLGLGLVQAATACALVEIDAGPPGRCDAARTGSRCGASGRSSAAIAIFVAVWVVLTTTVFLIPVAIWLAVRWCARRTGRRARGRRARSASLRRSARPRPASLDPRRLARRVSAAVALHRRASPRRDPHLPH